MRPDDECCNARTAVGSWAESSGQRSTGGPASAMLVASVVKEALAAVLARAVHDDPVFMAVSVGRHRPLTDNLAMAR